MDTILLPRRCGKTYALIKLASKERYGLIVCHSTDEAFRIIQMAQDMFANREIDSLPPTPITYDDFLNKSYYGKNVSKLFIDNADNLLQYLAKAEIGAITINGNKYDSDRYV